MTNIHVLEILGNDELMIAKNLNTVQGSQETNDELMIATSVLVALQRY